MLKRVMAENRGLVCYIPNQYIFHYKTAHQMPGLSNIVGYSGVHIGKNIANLAKTLISPCHVCVVGALRTHDPQCPKALSQ